LDDARSGTGGENFTCDSAGVDSLGKDCSASLATRKGQSSASLDEARYSEIASCEISDLRAREGQEAGKSEGAMSNQTGYIWRIKKSWYGRWYRDEIEDGIVVRRQHSEKLCAYGDRYRSEKDVLPLLAEKVEPVNEGRCSAESTMTIVDYVERLYFPYAESELKASTIHGYKGLWRMYLKPHLGKVSLRDFTCGKACRLLADIHAKHKLSTKSLRHCKGLLQTIFAHAKRMDVLAGENPVKDAIWPKGPKGAKAANKTYAYTVGDMSSMLHVLPEVAKIAIALMYFCGLRPGEARGVRWSDYDEKKRILNVKVSVWRKHETTPKTEESIAPVPVNKALSEILSEVERSSEYILATPTGRPIDLHNLAARTIKPALDHCIICQKSKHKKTDHTDHEFERDPSLPVWKGFYALRRGIGTALADVDSPMAAKSALRHANMATTTAHYVKSVDAAAIRGLDKVSALFDNTDDSGRPN
jgi:integrase